MMRGFIVVITAGMAMFFLKKKQYFHHYISLFAIVLAIASVGLVGIGINNQSSGQATKDGDKTTAFGLILLIVAQFFTGG